MTESANTSQPATRKCTRCHRVLRSAESVARGFGPTCYAKVQAVAKTSTEKPAQIAKAAEVIELGGIVPVRGRRIFRVVSTKGDQTYLTAATGQCTCSAGLRGRYGCYHALAARLVQAA